MNGEEQEHSNQGGFRGWPCGMCKCNFATKSQYEHHKHNSRNHILCLYCPEVVDFDSEELLNRHCLKNHAQEYCTFCKEHQQDKWHGWLAWHRKLHRLGRWNGCQCGRTFVNSYELKEHWKSAPEHRNTYCRHCERNLENAQDLAWHLKNECDQYMPFMPGLKPPNAANPPQGLRADTGPDVGVRPRLYDIIGVDQSCSHFEMQKAAKRMRIECHPDKLKRKGGLSIQDMLAIDTRAQEVGHAADVLSDFVSRCNYDVKVVMGRAK